MPGDDELSHSSPRKRRRIISGCQRCRTRHLRCDTALPSCARCVEAETECIRGINVRFKDLRGARLDPNLIFLKEQPWIQPSDEIRYYDETAEIMSLYESGGQLSTGTATTFDDVDKYGSHKVIPESPANSVSQPESICSNYAPSDLGGLGIDRTPNSDKLFFPSQTTPQSSVGVDLFASPEHLDVCHGFEYASNKDRPQLAQLSHREAFLMRNYIENMALWADVSDLQRHFEVAVPRRALQHPVLRLAIFAFSARHANRKSGDSETEALQYHNECLQLLIPTVSETDDSMNEDILASIAILRQYEEMDTYDNRCHLIGTTRILNSLSTFGSSGGLGEAVAWLCLRQDIYVSLVSQQPLRTHLENYRASQTMQRKDDQSWANEIVYLLAKVLTCAFVPDQISCKASLAQMNEEIELWNISKPGTFEPIKFVARNRELGNPFPEIWLLSAFHVIALQYYHIAKLVLAVSTRRPQSSGYENLRQGRKIEKAVRNHLLVIIGLAASNKRTAENTLFTARHTLSVWGGVLRDTFEQDGAVSFLLDMETITGWRAGPLIQSLREQWDEDGGSD